MTVDIVRRIRRAGAVCLVAGIAGTATNLLLAVVQPDVPGDRFSHPQEAGEYLVTQIWWTVQRLGLAAGLMALSWTGAVPRTRLGRVGHAGSVSLMLALAVAEAVAISARDATDTSAIASSVGVFYGMVTFALGLALVAVGLAIARAGSWSGWRRWLVLAMGVWVFFPTLPAIAVLADGAQLVLAGWMLMFAALGRVLLRTGPTSGRPA